MRKSPKIPRGLMARIPGFHPGGPGSIPGVGKLFLIAFLFCHVFKQHILSSNQKLQQNDFHFTLETAKLKQKKYAWVKDSPNLPQIFGNTC